MARIIEISAKCCDMFSASLTDDGKQVGQDYDGYVPDFFPGKHFGDYVMLKIDVDTGKIENWKTPTSEDIEELFGEEGE